jgi:hypothetical protein
MRCDMEIPPGVYPICQAHPAAANLAFFRPSFIPAKMRGVPPFRIDMEVS